MIKFNEKESQGISAAKEFLDSVTDVWDFLQKDGINQLKKAFAKGNGLSYILPSEEDYNKRSVFSVKVAMAIASLTDSKIVAREVYMSPKQTVYLIYKQVSPLEDQPICNMDKQILLDSSTGLTEDDIEKTFYLWD